MKGFLLFMSLALAGTAAGELLPLGNVQVFQRTVQISLQDCEEDFRYGWCEVKIEDLTDELPIQYHKRIQHFTYGDHLVYIRYGRGLYEISYNHRGDPEPSSWSAAEPHIIRAVQEIGGVFTLPVFKAIPE